MTRIQLIIMTSVVFIVVCMGALLALKTDVVTSRVSGTIAAPPERVWEYITEPEYRARWMQFVTDSTQMYGDPGVGGGTMLLIVTQEGFRNDIYEEVLEAEIPRRIRYMIEQDAANVMTAYELSYGPEGTMLSIETERYLKKDWAQTLAVFLRDPGEDNLRHNFDALKALVEAKD